MQGCHTVARSSWSVLARCTCTKLQSRDWSVMEYTFDAIISNITITLSLDRTNKQKQFCDLGVMFQLPLIKCYILVMSPSYLRVISKINLPSFILELRAHASFFNLAERQYVIALISSSFFFCIWIPPSLHWCLRPSAADNEKPLDETRGSADEHATRGP